jgi:FkbM family methyltransferase
MISARTIRATAAASNLLFRYAPSAYLTLYDRYKSRSERGNIAVVRRYLRAGHHVLDIGANVGFYTRLMAGCVGPAGHVDAFEPAPVNHAMLVERLRAFPQARVHQAAVTERSGTVTLHLSPDLNVDHHTFATDEQRETIDVPAVALDDVFRNDPGAIHFIKMDIQGAEYQALLGMADVVGRSPELCILMELTPFLYDRFGAGVDAIMVLLDSWGFEVRRIGKRDGRLGERLTRDTAVPERTDPGAYFDVLCARPQMLYD